MATLGQVSVEYTGKDALLNNVPAILTYLLGTIILLHLWIVFGILYLLFCIVGVVLFLRLICPFCPSYDMSCCPCGYGKLSSRFFKRGDPSRFPRMFRIYIPVFSLIWVFPLLGGLILVSRDPTLYFLLLLSSFIVVGFILVPVFSRVHGCRDCPMKDECPWAK